MTNMGAAAAAPTTPSAVANAFLDIQAADNSSFPRIDQMKIQKLVFYSHAWWLAMRDGPLFEEEVYAWPWGPVVPSIYGAFKDFGRRPIENRKAMEIVRIGSSPLDFRFSAPPEPPPEVMEFLRSLWETHKGLSGVQLSNATHAPGEPWTIVKDQHGNLDDKPVIPNSLIREVFKGKLAA